MVSVAVSLQKKASAACARHYFVYQSTLLGDMLVAHSLPEEKNQLSLSLRTDQNLDRETVLAQFPLRVSAPSPTLTHPSIHILESLDFDYIFWTSVLLSTAPFFFPEQEWSSTMISS